MPKIRLVEDERGIGKLLRLPLANAGFELTHALTMAEGWEWFNTEEFDGILLDLNLPDGNGTELCRKVRNSSKIPILIISARRDEVDRILGLELGADDYILKPFSPREVVARLRAVLRREQWDQQIREDPSIAEFGGVAIDEARQEVTVDRKPISLTRTEFRLLLTLIRNPGRVYPREQLILKVWDGAFIVDRVVDSVVSRVRRKLGPFPDGRSRIKTVHGCGYALEEGWEKL